MFFVLGSVSISGMEFIGQTVKSVFFGTVMAVLFIIGIMQFYNYIKITTTDI